MHIFFARYEMTGRAWFRLLILSLVFNAVVCAVTLPFGLGLVLLPYAIPAGIVIAFLPALATVITAALFARLRGHFSFLQFFVIGTLVSCAIAWRAIALGNEFILDHIFFFIRTLPLVWLGGWVMANVLDVLPEPTDEGRQPFLTPGAVATGLISLVLIVVPTFGLTKAAAEAIEARELAAAAERRGDCPDDLQCVIHASSSRDPDPRVYAVSMGGKQFIVPANSIYMGMSTAEETPGETDVIRLQGLLPTFAARSAANIKAFSFPSPDVGYATIEPVCSPAGYCRNAPIALISRNPTSAIPPAFIQTSDFYPAPSGLEYVGDIASIAAERTTIENADRHVYKSASGDEFVLCHTDRSAVSPSCEHTFTLRDLRIELRYKRPWLNDWAAIRANAIALINHMLEAEAPADVIHLVDRAPKH